MSTESIPSTASAVGAISESPLPIAPGETWCRTCGAEGSVLFGDVRSPATIRRCVFCGSPDIIPAAEVLRPGEYTVVGNQPRSQP